MVRTAIMFALISLSLTASAIADEQDDAMADHADAAADEASDGIDYADAAIDALDRQGSHLTGARTHTEAAIKQTEDLRYRDLFSQIINALKQIVQVLLFIAVGGVGGVGALKLGAHVLGRMKDAKPTPEPPKA